MFVRQIIRSKVLQMLYAYAVVQNASLQKSESELAKSLKSTQQLYYLAWAIIFKIRAIEQQKINERKLKHLPEFRDLNPNYKFVEMPLLEAITHNNLFNHAMAQNNAIDINDNDACITPLYLEFINSEPFAAYMADPNNDLDSQKKLLLYFAQEILLVSENFHDFLEETNIYWNDDLALITDAISKNIENCRELPGMLSKHFLFDLFEHDEIIFAKELLQKTIINTNTTETVIKQYLDNWDWERITAIDRILMQMAVTEFLYFPSIPTKVTLNEYIEVAKCYSTDKSSLFINGVLDRSLKALKTEQRILKDAKGMQGED